MTHCSGPKPQVVSESSMTRLQSIARSRRVRVALAICLVALGATGFLPYVFNTISTQAAVNAPLIRLTAAVDGTVADLPENGHFFAEPGDIKLLELSQDTGAVADLKAEADLAAAQMQLARRQLAELAGQRQKLGHRAALFASATGASLAQNGQSQAAVLRGCEADRTTLAAVRDRAILLAKQGFMAAAGVEKVQADALAKDSECRSDAAKLRAVEVQRRAAASGVFISDGYNDAPYAEQQADRLILQRQMLEKTLSDANAHYTQATLRLRDAVARAHYRAPAGMMVWSSVSSTGAAIRAGEPVLDLVDCRRRFVQVALPESKAESIRPGSPASVRLIGGSAWMTGEVVNITGAAGRAEAALFAANTDNPAGSREISIKVALPAQSPKTLSIARKCDVGRLAEVRFSRVL